MGHKISTPEKILLTMLGLANDGLEIFFDLLALTGVGLAGEAIMEPIDLVFDFVVTTYFIFRTGWGKQVIVQFVADILEAVGVPGRTASIWAGIRIVENPNSNFARFAQVATVVEGNFEGVEGEAAALESEAAAAGEFGAGAETAGVEVGEPGEAGASAKVDVQGEMGTGVETGAAEPEAGEHEKTRGELEAEEKLMPEAEKNPMEVEQKKLLEETPGGKKLGQGGSNGQEEEGDEDYDEDGLPMAA